MTLRETIIFKQIDKVLTYGIIAYLLLIGVMLLVDTFDFFKRPEDYIRIHDLDPTKTFWQLQYLKMTGLFFFGSVSALTIIFYSLRRQSNNKLLVVRQIIVFSLTVILFYGFFQWYLTGFDH